MKINKSIITLVFIFIILINPINSSNNSNYSQNQGSELELNNLSNTIINISSQNSQTSNLTTINKIFNDTLENDISKEVPKEEITKNKKLEKPDGKTYLINPLTQEKYEIKKMKGGEYEFISFKDGKKFHNFNEFNYNYLKQNRETKLRGGLNLLESNNTIRVLVTLKTNSLEIQKGITKIEDKYEDGEKEIKNKIRNISIKYSPKTKEHARSILLSKEIIEIPKKDLEKIMENGERLESIKGNKISEIKEELSLRYEKNKEDFVSWIGNKGGEIKRNLDRINVVSVEIPAELLNEILDREDVVSVELDKNLIEPKLGVSNPTVSPSSWWNDGYKGGWVDVAVADTGIDPTHPALEKDAEGFFRTFISQDFTSSGTTDDIDGHGTHVAGIIASSDSTYKGIAPGTDTLINAKHLGGVSSDSLAALDWAITNPSDGAEILSNSWGLFVSDCNDEGFTWADGDTISWTLYIDAAIDYYDLISVNAAGNDGSCGEYSLTSPADSYNSIVVGAIDDQGTTSRGDDIWLNEAGWFSSSVGPTWDGRKKPDITAPGLNIKSANTDWEGFGFNFIDKSGTSMAAPHISGAANLLLEYGLSSKGTKALLINTAEDKGSSGWDAYYGWGEIDLNKAYTYRDYVIDDSVNEGGYKLYKVQQFLTGEKATLVWNRHVVYGGASTPASLYGVNDLDIHLYKEVDGTQQDMSQSIKDNVEQIVSPSQFIGGVVKVMAYTTDFSHGQNTESYSLATEGGYSLVNGPSLNISQNTPLVVNDSSSFTINTTLSNNGDLDSHSILVTLNLPFGLTTSSNEQNIISLADGNSRITSWDVNANSLGTFNNIQSSFSSSSYGESSSGSSSIDSVIVIDDDTTAPVFNEIIYPSTNKTYNSLTIKANITDYSGINYSRIYYDYGNDSIIDGSILMNLEGDLYGGVIPLPGNDYRNKYIRFFIESSDNDSDRINDQFSGNSTDNYIFIENEIPEIISHTPSNQNLSVNENNSLIFTHFSDDMDGDSLDYSWYVDNIFGKAGQNFTYTPGFEDEGSHNITLIVSDSINFTSTFWNVLVNNTNRAPQWNLPLQNQIIEEDTSLVYNINVSDPDNDLLTYYVNNSDFLISDNGLLTWAPEENWHGIKYVNITVSDYLINITDKILINVTPVNDAPILNTISNITVNESNLVHVNSSGEVFATDIDSNILIYDYSLPLNSSGHWQTNFSSSGRYTTNITVSDGNLNDYQEIIIIINNDLDRDGIPDYADFDDDNDGINDTEDFLSGNTSDVSTNVNNLSLLIGNSSDMMQKFNEVQRVEFKESDETLVDFNFNFSSSNLNLENIKIEKQAENDLSGFILIKGIQLTGGETKTVYVNNLDSGSNSVCIKDAEINSITEISSSCDGANEFVVNCPGVNGNYICNEAGNKYKIDGLSNSGIKEFFVSPSDNGDSPSSSGSGGGGGGGGSSGSGSYNSNSSPEINTEDFIDSQPAENNSSVNETTGEVQKDSTFGFGVITGAAIGAVKTKGLLAIIFIIVITVLVIIFNPKVRLKTKSMIKTIKEKTIKHTKK